MSFKMEFVMQSQFRKFLADQSGATAVEYSILIALIAITLIPAANLLGSKISAQFNAIANSLTLQMR